MYVCQCIISLIALFSSTEHSTIFMEMEAKLPPNQNAESKLDSAMRFSNSLLDLRELRSQLHYAADYCETAFLKAEDKKDVMESTKEYICRAVVTIVDHIGSVSANLDSVVSGANSFSEVEFRIDCLKQRILSCEQYAHNLALTRMRWSENIPKFHSRYLLSTITSEKASKKDIRNSKSTTSKIINEDALETNKHEPLFVYTCIQQPSLARNSLSRTGALEVIPVRNDLSVLTKGSNPTFHFQSTQKVARGRKPLHGGDILSVIRRTRRNVSKQIYR